MLIIFIIMIGAVLFEIFCECLLNYQMQKRDKEIRPNYQWSTYTSKGCRTGLQEGILKLMLYPGVGYINFPNQETPYFSINSKGFRGAEVEEKQKARKRIVVVGGSAAFGTGLKRDSETFCAQLDKKLGDVEVINAAAIGHSSGQELVYLLRDLIDLEPGLIIAFNGHNDYAYSWHSNYRWSDFQGHDELENQLHKMYLLTHSNFFARCANIYRVIFAKTLYKLRHSYRIKPIKNLMGKIIGSNDDRNEKELHKRLGAISSIYIRNIMKMNRLAKAYNANFLCVLQPSEVTITTGKGHYAIFCSKVRKLLDQYKIPYIVLNDYAMKLKKDMFMSTLHLDERGNKVIADILAEKIIKEGLI